MTVVEIELPPGVVNTAAKKAKTANWQEVNLVRWEGSTLSPIGGWEQVAYTAFASRVRKIHKWVTNDDNVYTAYLCEEHCYVDIAGVLTDITPVGLFPAPSAADQGGYGDLKYGDNFYGTPRASRNRTIIATPCFTLDNWGEELRVMTSPDGRYMRWDPAAPTSKLTAVAGAPVSNRSFCITPERHAMLFGAGGNPSKFQWSDQEDDTEWTPGPLTKAGSYDVEPRSPIVSHGFVGGNILMSTGRAIHRIYWTGLPQVYSYEKVSETPGPISAAAIVEIAGGAVWQSGDGFWIYNGISADPLPCPIWDWISDGFSHVGTRYDGVAIHVVAKGEVWFCFSSGEGAFTNNRAAIYNYHDKLWSMGLITRTCGHSYPNDKNPVMSDGTVIYKHEEGFVYPGITELPWAETFNMNIERGWNLMTIKNMLPNITGGKDNIQFKFYKSMDPSAESETVSDAKIIRSNGYVDVRETARDFRMRVEMVGSNNWTMGPVGIDVVKRGMK